MSKEAWYSLDIDTHMHIHASRRTSPYVHVYACVCMYTCACMRACMRTLCIYVHARMHSDTHFHIAWHLCHECVCVCVCIRASVSRMCMCMRIHQGICVTYVYVYTSGHFELFVKGMEGLAAGAMLTMIAQVVC